MFYHIHRIILPYLPNIFCLVIVAATLYHRWIGVVPGFTTVAILEFISDFSQSSIIHRIHQLCSDNPYLPSDNPYNSPIIDISIYHKWRFLVPSSKMRCQLSIFRCIQVLGLGPSGPRTRGVLSDATSDLFIKDGTGRIL